MSEENRLDILRRNDINQECVINGAKENIDSFDHNKKAKCRILKFLSDWSFEEVVVKIPTLDINRYPQLFIFVIDIKANDFNGSVKFLESSLANFSKSRPIILQLTSENSTKIYYKDENCNEFCKINEKAPKNKNFKDFSSFLWLYFKKIDNFEDVMLNKLPQIKNSSIILKFLRTLIFENYSEEFYYKLVLKCAANGSKSDILAAIDGFYDDTGMINGTEVELFLSNNFFSTSVLHTAVQNSNRAITNFLIEKCCCWILQLPFDHQIEISTTAFTSGQLDVLCDLLESCDFPFPKELNPATIIHERLKKIVNDRIQFHADVLAENRSKIRGFIKHYSKWKFAFNLENKSAIGVALQEKKFKTFIFLKANRFRENEIENISIDNLTEEEDKKSARKFASVQTRRNVSISTFDEDLSVLQLTMKSLIYNRDKTNPLEQDQRKIIKKWYSEIYKTTFGSKLIDAVVQCKDLKIVFDFECKSTENVDMSSTSGSLGVTYPISKWIFIGAKLNGTNNRNQKIKGVIAHEICHYVMRLVYQNDENPYYSDDEKRCAEFEAIVKEIKAVLFPNNEQDEANIQESSEEEQVMEEEEGKGDVKEGDDKCDGIISSVYISYPKMDRHPELIVRPVHIQAQFDNNWEKFNDLEKMYKDLFDFFKFIILPEIEKFCLQKRENIQILNDVIGVLNELQTSPLKLQPNNHFNELFSNKSAILTTNVPKLLLLDIYNYLTEKYKELMEVRNIFVTPENLEISKVSKKFDFILKENSNFNILVDCTKGCGTSHKINAGEDSKLFFITSKDNQNKELISKIMKQDTNLSELTINYSWMNLNDESQQLLLQTKINFQNNSTLSLSELILNETDRQQPELNQNLEIIIDDQLLNSLVDKSEININQIILENSENNKLKILFQVRNLIKKYKKIEHLKTLEFIEEGTGMPEKTVDGQHSNINNITSDETNAQLETKGRKEINLNETRADQLQFLSGKTMNQFEEIDITEKMTQGQMINDVENKKCVLISDKAGSGKSWILKSVTNILREKYRDKWISYVDLKQFIPKFEKQDIEFEFSAFMAENILKPKTKYEGNIFKKLYKNGKVCILFDGFDEIAPDCAEFVTKLFQSFKQNGGNQLWIATRDYFEVDLKDKLGLDAVYKLDEFTEENGVDMIASSWILSEMKNAGTIQNLNSHKDYKEIAKKIIEKVPKMQNNSIGLPQFYKMIADITQDNKNTAIDLTTFKIFKECVEIQCKNWSLEKGELRTKESIESHNKELNYQKLHQLVAMKSLFPDDSEFCDLNIEDLKDWIDEKILACGMLTKIGEIFLFSHETFREFFVAKFILRILMKAGKRDDNEICEYLIKILTVRKFGIIRMFLNEAFAEKTTLTIIEQKIPNIIKNFCKHVEKMENLCHTFLENLEYLSNFLLKIFENGSWEQMKDILLRNKDILPASIKNNFLFTKVQDFVMNYFKGNDFRDFMSNNKIFLSIFASSFDTQTITAFLKATEIRTNLDFVKESLQIKDENGENLCFYLVRSDYFSSESIQQAIQILKTYLNMEEIIELIKECNINGWNILHLCGRDKYARKLEALWNSLEFILKSENISEEFKKLFSQITLNENYNFLHLTTTCKEIEFHETIWRLLLKTFENREELKDLITQGDKNRNNYVHLLLIYDTQDIIESTFRKIKDNFRNDQYEEILKSKENTGRNLLQIAACISKDIKTHQILWKIFRDFYKSDNEEFVKNFNDVDYQGNNVFNLAARFSSKEIFEFMINELETNDGIRNILRTLGLSNRNLLQSAVRRNESVECHEYLWKIMRKYLNSQEILDMIKHTDEEGDNLIFCNIKWNTKEILELTWSEIMNSFNTTENESTIQQFLTYVNNNQENILHTLMKSKDSLKLKYFWLELEKYFTKTEFKNLLSQKKSKNGQNILHHAAKCDEPKFHEALLELLLNTFENRGELKDLIMQGDKDGDNYVHLLVIWCKFDAAGIECIFKKLSKVFNTDQYEEILNCKGFFNRSLLQIAAIYKKSFEVHQALWKIYLEFFDDSQMFDLIKHTDLLESNVLINAVERIPKNIVMLIWNEIREILILPKFFNQKLSDQVSECEEYLMILLEHPSDEEKMKTMKRKWNKLIKEFGFFYSLRQLEQFLNKEISANHVKNLHYLASFDELEQHKSLWGILFNSFKNKEELKEFLLKKDSCENNFLHLLVLNDNPDIIEFTLNILKTSFSDEQFREILQSKGRLESHLLQIAAKNVKNIKTHQILWKIFLNTFKSEQKFLKLIQNVDKNENNVLHDAVSVSTAETFDFMIKTFEKSILKDEVKNLLSTLGFVNKNILQIASIFNKSLEFHEKLWEIIQKYFNSTEILEMVNYCDKDGDNILHAAIYCNVNEIVEFTWKQIKKFIKTKDKQIEYLRKQGHNSHSLLQMSFENIFSENLKVRFWVQNTLSEYENDLELD